MKEILNEINHVDFFHMEILKKMLAEFYSVIKYGRKEVFLVIKAQGVIKVEGSRE